MNSKFLLLSCLVLFSSCFIASYSSRELQELYIGNVSGVGGGDGGDNSTCLVKLLPCKPYLKSSSSPPATCCVPLKEVVDKEAECLCDVLHNPAVMASFNVTLDEALNLAKACGANPDMSKCKATSPTSSPTTPPSPNNSSSGGSSSSTPSANSATNGIPPHYAGIGFIAFLVGLLAV